MKNIQILGLFLTFNLCFFAQNVEFKGSNFKDKKDEFKKIEAGLKKADASFELANEAFFSSRTFGTKYKEALVDYLIAQKFNPNNGELNFKIGVCYINSTDPQKGIPYIKAVRKLDPKCSPFLSFYEGRASQFEGKFDVALKSYTQFAGEYKKADDFSKFVKAHQKECNAILTAMTKPERVFVDNVAPVNSEQDDVSPTVSTDGSEMLFSSMRPNKNPINGLGEYDYEIYSASKSEKGWGTPKRLEGPINSQTDDVSNMMYYDGTKMMLHRMVEGQGDLYESKLIGTTWSPPVTLHSNINTSKTNETYGVYNNDGFKVYFSRMSEQNANGNEVCFSGMSSKTAKDYKIATVVSAVVSKFDDIPVYITIDGAFMYIASKGHDSYGGYDIFVCDRTSTGWGTPKNLGYPINTQYDDFFFATTANNKYAYISSNRAGGKGGLDVYQVTFLGPEKKPVISTEDYLLGSNAQPIKDQSIEASVSINKVSLTVFKGSTIDALTRKPVEASIEIYDNTSGKMIESFTTNSATGKFLITLTAGRNYGIAVKATGYLFHSENFDIATGSEYNMVNKVIELKNIAIGSKIALRNVFFDLAKANLRPESNSELDRLVKLMNEVPKLKVEISGHTDNTGSAIANETLSQQRADAVVAYLSSKGIGKDRLISKGYGSNRPVAGNENENGRQQNRRTEFEIKGN